MSLWQLQVANERRKVISFDERGVIRAEPILVRVVVPPTVGDCSIILLGKAFKLTQPPGIVVHQAMHEDDWITLTTFDEVQ